MMYANETLMYKKYFLHEFSDTHTDHKKLSIQNIFTFLDEKLYFNKDIICYCWTQKQDEDTEDICKFFEFVKFIQYRSLIIISLIIAAMNYIFRTILIYYTAILKPETGTVETNQVKTAVFICTFLNSGILLILMSANSSAPILKHIFKGRYTDFSSDWFDDVGLIIIMT